MQFLAILRRKLDVFSAEHFEPFLEPEAEKARAMYAAGTFRALWGRGDEPGAVILIEAADLTAAQAALGALPLVEKGMLESRIIPIGPYRGFGPRS